MFEAAVITLPVSAVSLPIRRSTQADSECYLLEKRTHTVTSLA